MVSWLFIGCSLPPLEQDPHYSDRVGDCEVTTVHEENGEKSTHVTGYLELPTGWAQSYELFSRYNDGETDHGWVRTFDRDGFITGYVWDDDWDGTPDEDCTYRWPGPQTRTSLCAGYGESTTLTTEYDEADRRVLEFAEGSETWRAFWEYGEAYTNHFRDQQDDGTIDSSEWIEWGDNHNFFRYDWDGDGLLDEASFVRWGDLGNTEWWWFHLAAGTSGSKHTYEGDRRVQTSHYQNEVRTETTYAYNLEGNVVATTTTVDGAPYSGTTTTFGDITTIVETNVDGSGSVTTLGQNTEEAKTTEWRERRTDHNGDGLTDHTERWETTTIGGGLLETHEWHGVPVPGEQAGRGSSTRRTNADGWLVFEEYVDGDSTFSASYTTDCPAAAQELTPFR